MLPADAMVAMVAMVAMFAMVAMVAMVARWRRNVAVIVCGSVPRSVYPPTDNSIPLCAFFVHSTVLLN